MDVRSLGVLYGLTAVALMVAAIASGYVLLVVFSLAFGAESIRIAVQER